MRHYDTIVIGGGIMGLSCALEEVQRGKKVALLDKHKIAQKASWAASGILMSLDARKYFSSFREFYVRSTQLYPQWLEKIAAGVPQAKNVYWPGAYHIFPTHTLKGQKEYQKLEAQLDREESSLYEKISEFPLSLQKHFSPGDYQGFYFPQDGFLDVRALLWQLEEANKNRGVDIFPHTEVTAVQVLEKVMVESLDNKFSAQNLIVTAGAWLNEILSLVNLKAPLVPVKGQLFRIPRFYSEEVMIHFQRDLHLVPNKDTLVVGATTEPRIWEEDFTEEGKSELQRNLEEIFPGMEKNILEGWAGIRPRPKDRLPWIGYLNAEKNISICSGHYKSGIGMAPLSALCLSQLINGEELSFDLETFCPLRKKGICAAEGEVEPL